jgi:hypothetical protein
MRKLISFLIVFCFFVGLFSSDVAFAEDPNGCGTEKTKNFVPDKFFGICDFTAACNKHDVCYSGCKKDDTTGVCAYTRCQPKGDAYGKPICTGDTELAKSLQAAKAAKTKCDNAFFDDMFKSNGLKCAALALFYTGAVKALGWENFKGEVSQTGTRLAVIAHKGSAKSGVDVECFDRKLEQTVEQRNELIKRFLENATDNQLQAFIDDQKSATPRINLLAVLELTEPTVIENVGMIRNTIATNCSNSF